MRSGDGWQILRQVNWTLIPVVRWLKTLETLSQELLQHFSFLEDSVREKHRIHCKFCHKAYPSQPTWELLPFGSWPFEANILFLLTIVLFGSLSQTLFLFSLALNSSLFGPLMLSGTYLYSQFIWVPHCFPFQVVPALNFAGALHTFQCLWDGKSIFGNQILIQQIEIGKIHQSTKGGKCIMWAKFKANF